MTTDTKQTILDAAQAMVQANGYNALSFRDVGAAIGIKSASIHYHFPTKGDLGAALARRYTERGKAALDRLRAESAADVPGHVARFIGIFRAALANGNRMCLIGIMAAEHADLPDPVRAEVANFTDVCVAWLVGIVSVVEPDGARALDRAYAIFGAIQGAQLVARGRNDVDLFDRLIATYRDAGLIP
jgi:TetR/AcrR family transcriptional repressor of nem operon